MNKFYGKEIVQMMKKKKAMVLNGGFIAGSTEKMLQFLKTMKSTSYTITCSLKIQEYLLALCGKGDN